MVGTPSRWTGRANGQNRSDKLSTTHQLPTGRPASSFFVRVRRNQPRVLALAMSTDSNTHLSQLARTSRFGPALLMKTRPSTIASSQSYKERSAAEAERVRGRPRDV